MTTMVKKKKNGNLLQPKSIVYVRKYHTETHCFVQLTFTNKSRFMWLKPSSGGKRENSDESQSDLWPLPSGPYPGSVTRIVTKWDIHACSHFLAYLYNLNLTFQSFSYKLKIIKMISLFWGKAGLEKSLAEYLNLVCHLLCLKSAILLPLPSELLDCQHTGAPHDEVITYMSIVHWNNCKFKLHLHLTQTHYLQHNALESQQLVHFQNGIPFVVHCCHLVSGESIKPGKWSKLKMWSIVLIECILFSYYRRVKNDLCRQLSSKVAWVTSFLLNFLIPLLSRTLLCKNVYFTLQFE